MPLISVVMPVYNAEHYVGGAIESILTQTLADFEFLILDDGSTDRTPEILKRYAERDPRIHLVSRPNRGLVPTLNEGLALARGEFIARMDADDLALPQRFERQVAYLREHPEVLCMGGAAMEIDAAGRDLVVTRNPPDDETIQEFLVTGHNRLFHPTVMMRREPVLAVGGYREEMKVGQDLDLWLRLGEAAAWPTWRRSSCGIAFIRALGPNVTKKRGITTPRWPRTRPVTAAASRGASSRLPPTA